MPEPVRQYYYEQTTPIQKIPVRPSAPVHPLPVRRKTVTRKVKKTNFFHRLISVTFVLLIGIFILPIGFNQVTRQFIHGSLYPDIKYDYRQMRFPTTDYLSNHWFLGENSLQGAKVKKPLMTPIVESSEMKGLENKLNALAKSFPSVHPAVYVWDYETGNYTDINSDELFAAASIIKLPVLVHLFRSIELEQFSLEDEMVLTDYYRAEGSGSLQFKAENSKYTIDKLARVMITESDNSSTNMIMAKLGSMTDVNSAVREWGLKNTNIQTWLPDMDGTNLTTARDMATILYNIDNPGFLNLSSREHIFDYMGQVENNRLIKAGLDEGADFLHKTGDIGTMLGDAGIVYAPNGKRYIVVILATRPNNSPAGKDFIVKASEIIYNFMVK